MSPSLAAPSHLQILHFYPSPENPPLFSKPQNPCQRYFSPSSCLSPFLFPTTITKHQRHPVNPSPNKPIITTCSNDAHLSLSSVLCPSLAYANAYFFDPGNYNVQVVVSENEPEDKLVNRFRKEVLKAGVLQECKRRRFFETTQEKRKRKTRDAARRFRKRRPQAKASQERKEEVMKKGGYKSEDDYWEFQDVELPYC